MNWTAFQGNWNGVRTVGETSLGSKEDRAQIGGADRGDLQSLIRH
jgi:hypothetical protein